MLGTLTNWWRSRKTAQVAEWPYARNRRIASYKYLRGAGLEVGALHCALPVADGVKVTYVDRMSNDELRRQYPELAAHPLVPIDVVDDGERLLTFADESQDFVIANHFLEHAQDPIGALAAHLRVLRPGGIAFVVVPNREMTFDRDRPATTWEHFRRDHIEGADISYDEHLREYCRLVDKCEGAALEERIERYRRMAYSIHFHVWNAAEFHDFLERVRGEFRLPFQIVKFSDQQSEMLAVLRKLA